MNKLSTFRTRSVLLKFLGTLIAINSVGAAGQERWFQIEVSIFSNESPEDKSEEFWQPDQLNLVFPEKIRRLDRLIDILMIDDLHTINTIEALTAGPTIVPEKSQLMEREESILTTKPQTRKTNNGYRFFDFSRDDFLQLPPGLSEFRQTNQALERSPDHRLLFHGLWRQVVASSSQAEPVYIQGGLAYGVQHELQGSLTIHFNENQDRVIADTNLWLAEFSIVENSEETWELPLPPEEIADSLNYGTTNPDLNYHPIRIYHMQQDRDMRSNEFHYLDHPALGVVILVKPYEKPALAPNNSDF